MRFIINENLIYYEPQYYARNVDKELTPETKAY